MQCARAKSGQSLSSSSHADALERPVDHERFEFDGTQTQAYVSNVEALNRKNM